MRQIPAFVIEYFLHGSGNAETLDRFTQDGGVVADVWLAYANDRQARQRVLLSPTQGLATSTVAAQLHWKIIGARQGHAGKTGVAALDAYAVAKVDFFELIHVVLPMTDWWEKYKLSEIRSLIDSKREFVSEAVYASLSGVPAANFLLAYEDGPDRLLAKRLYDAAPVLGLIGIFIATDRGALSFSRFPDSIQAHSVGGIFFGQWMFKNIDQIAKAVCEEFLERSGRYDTGSEYAESRLKRREDRDHVSGLIQRVFLDRDATVSDFEALGTIKADAANRVFDVACRNLTWAVIDSGIDRTHPAFYDHDVAPAKWVGDKPPSRIKRTYDFTLIERIRGMDLVTGGENSQQRLDEIHAVVDDMLKIGGRGEEEIFRIQATENLHVIASQLEHELNPDWKLIEPLIELLEPDESTVVSDHGTHVAGILAGDWRSIETSKSTDASPPAVTSKSILKGVCPDINVYDLRVLGSGALKGLESSVISALDFIRYLNEKGPNETTVAGVNISMSIPYNPGIYGCGATPVCVAADRLSDSGVVVVAAAGNRGWSQQATSMGTNIVFGQALFSTVTDPGNAHQVITVGSTHRLKPHLHGVSFFSGRGPTVDGRVKPDLVAPGEKIRGPVPGDDEKPKDGTSMAAPFVSGAAAMLMARHIELMGKPQRVKEILCATATDLGREKYFQGFGLVDVLRAIQSV